MPLFPPTASASVGVLPSNGLLNGGFDYWQAGTSATVTATGGGTPTNAYLYQADQWYVRNVLGGGTIEGIITYSQVAAVQSSSGFGASVKITTAPTGTGIQNGCELWQTLSNKASLTYYGQTSSFSIQAKALGNVTQIGVQFFYATTEVKAVVANTIGSEILTTVNSSTFTQCSINGQAIGTSQTMAGVIGVRIRPTAVSSGNLYDLNNGFVVEQGMLNTGATVAAFSRQYNDPVQELQGCQYFYEKIGGDVSAETLGAAYSSSTTVAQGIIMFKVKKRATPVISFSSTSALTYANAAGTFAATALSSSNIGLQGTLASITTSGIAGANLPGVCISNSTGYILVDSRL